MPSLYEHAGGEEALHRLEDSFYSSVLVDPLLQPLLARASLSTSTTSLPSPQGRLVVPIGLLESSVSST